jgi:hypothetical protein
LLVGDLAEPGVEGGIAGSGLGDSVGLGGIVGEVDEDDQGFLGAEGVGQGAARGPRGRQPAEVAAGRAMAARGCPDGRGPVSRSSPGTSPGHAAVVHGQGGDTRCAIVAVLVQDVQRALEARRLARRGRRSPPGFVRRVWARRSGPTGRVATTPSYGGADKSTVSVIMGSSPWVEFVESSRC